MKKIHKNSRESYKTFSQLSQRQQLILDLLAHQVVPLTDREIKRKLGLYDMNQVRPRVTELLRTDHIMEVDSVQCQVTGKKVRRVVIC
jgi:hypothetical protein